MDGSDDCMLFNDSEQVRIIAASVRRVEVLTVKMYSLKTLKVTNMT